MTKLRRNYSESTIKTLFALSGNQCAHPECTTTLIEPSTGESDSLVTGHICHIFAINPTGPRSNSALTENELNSPENLILLCPHHHRVVDGQHETYPATVLQEWKRQHELKIQRQLHRSRDWDSLPSSDFSNSYFPTELVDQRIENDVGILRKSRFFVEFSRVRSALLLSKRLIDGELSRGTNALRGKALAWCVRLLSDTEELDKAKAYLQLAKSLGTGTEIAIADAFIIAKQGEKGKALNHLASIDSPHARSAALFIVARHEGAKGAVEWLKTTGTSTTDLDADGKRFLLELLFDLAKWDDARRVLDVLSEQDFDETPVLHHIAAITYLLSTVPVEFRSMVRNQLPLNAASFPLASDATSMVSRRAAHRHFTDAANVARKLNCPKAAKVDDEYALWLELKDPNFSDDGRKRLTASLRDTKSALHLVPLGIQFGIDLSLDAVEKEIERQIALHGGKSLDAATARFALAFAQGTPEAAANYIARYYNELSEYIDKRSMLIVRIEMLLKAGQVDRANECLELLLQDGLSEEQESRIRATISEARGADSVGTREEFFKRTDSISDLVALVEELRTNEDWDGLCRYGEVLFRRTGSVIDAERLADGLTNTQKTDQLVTFLQSNAGLMSQSRQLRMCYAWSLYREGALLDARSELAKLSNDREDPNYRALQVQLAIALGDWNSLAEFVAIEYKEKDRRSAQELMGTAQLALYVSSPYAKELLYAAANKGYNDADILVTANLLAAKAGWDDDAEIFQWIQRASVLSGDSGPVQRVTLKDVFDRKPEWDRRESEIWQLLSRGEIPIFLAAESLNKSLINLMLFPALANLSESDPRRRILIPAFSSNDQRMPWDAGRSVGMDLTALFTLSFLNLLDKVLEIFDLVYLPHSTLIWLFEEKQKAAFHQPSRVRDAHRLRNLLATAQLEKFDSSTVTDSDLSAQVGDELAMLIAEAEVIGAEDDIQRIVVRPSPVYQLSSLMDEEADLTAHTDVLCTCHSVVGKLREKGQLTAEEEKRARTYLKVQEKPWSNQPVITDGAILYLDDLALNYFLRLGILEKLKAAGFRPIVSPRSVSEADELIAFDSIAGKVIDALERIQSSLSTRIESGKIKVGKQRTVNKLSEKLIPEHPTVGLLALAKNYDTIILDDRYVNQHSNIDDGCSRIPVFTTLDLLDVLACAGAITFEDVLEYRTQLRRAGYFFVPVRDDELKAHLSASVIQNGKVVETAELKAIRENLLRVRMSDSLQLPKEAHWLNSTIEVFIQRLKTMWVADRSTDVDLSGVTARADWLLDQLDIRGWAQCLQHENRGNFVKSGRGTQILRLLILPLEAPQKARDAYWKWVENRILLPVKEQDTELYEWIVDQYRRRIEDMADVKLDEGGTV